MENSDYNELLQKKISKELSDFINELKTKTPEEVIESAYELIIKEDIASVFECINYSQQEAKALYEEKFPLEACYQEWLHNDQTYMDIIVQTVEDKIRSSVSQRRKK